MKSSFFGLLLVGVVLVFGCTGCITKSNITTTGSSPRFVPGTTNVVFETFSHTDKSLRVVQPEWGGGHSAGFFRFNASVGGLAPMGGQYGYGAGSYGYRSEGTYVQSLSGHQPTTGWSSVMVPIESQGAYQRQTWERYGFGHPPVQSGGGRYGY